MDLFDLIRIGLFLLFIVGPIMRGLNKNSSKTRQKPTTNKRTTAIKRTIVNKRTIVSKTNDDFNARLEDARRRVQEAMDNASSSDSKPRHSQSHSKNQHVGSLSEDELFHGQNKSKHIAMPDGFSQEMTVSKHQNLPKDIGGRKRVPTTLTGQTAVTHQGLPTGMTGHVRQVNHQQLSQEFTGRMDNAYTQPQFEIGLDKLEQHHSKHVKFKQHSKVLTKKTKKTVTLKGSVIQTDAKSIVNGIIWHQILSEPRYKKSWRE